jgi:hypothetical protein
MSFKQNVGYYHNINIGNKTFESVSKFTYLGTGLIYSYQNCTYTEDRTSFHHDKPLKTDGKEVFIILLLFMYVIVKVI